MKRISIIFSSLIIIIIIGTSSISSVQYSSTPPAGKTGPFQPAGTGKGTNPFCKQAGKDAVCEICLPSGPQMALPGYYP